MCVMLQAEIVAMVHNTVLKEGIGAVSVLNTFYKHNITLGAYKGPFDYNQSGDIVCVCFLYY
jgi:hypothetical protein